MKEMGALETLKTAVVPVLGGGEGAECFTVHNVLTALGGQIQVSSQPLGLGSQGSTKPLGGEGRTGVSGVGNMGREAH